MFYDLTRRRFLAGTGAGAAALAAPRLVFADTAKAGEILKGSGKVVVSTWGGSYTDAQKNAMFNPFTKATGIQVVTTGTPDPAKLKLMEDNDSSFYEWAAAQGDSGAAT